MKESNLKLAQKDIDEALKAVEEMESYINEGKEKNNLLKEKPEVIKRISSNYISSYLNVTPETLSRIKSKR